VSVPARAGNVTRTRLTAVELGDGRRRTADQLATEEPMEIRVDAPGLEQRRVAVTMRTPGHDFELAAGFLFTEGIVSGQADVGSVRYCDVPREEQQYNVVTVDLRLPYDPELLQRNFYTTSSCGVCGKASLDSIAVRCEAVAEGPEVAEAVVVALPGRLRLAEAIGERREQRGVDAERRGHRLRLPRHRRERALAAHTARRRRVEASLRRLAQQRSLHLDDVPGQVRRRPGGVWRVARDQPLADQEAERQLVVVPRRAHRHGERVPVDADLERLLDRDVVAHPVVLDPRRQRHGARLPAAPPHQ
jgi:hypothetical protein